MIHNNYKLKAEHQEQGEPISGRDNEKCCTNRAPIAAPVENDCGKSDRV